MEQMRVNKDASRKEDSSNGKSKGHKKIAENNGILTKIEEQIIEEGWEGKLKGMLQILWE
jgi:hypothetical protein